MQCQIVGCSENAKVRIKLMFSIRTPTEEISNVEAWMPLCQNHSTFAFCTIPSVWTSEVEKIEKRPAPPFNPDRSLIGWIEQGQKPPKLSIVDPDEEC